MQAELLLTNANIIPMTAPTHRATTLAVSDGRIVAVGDRQLVAATGPGTRVVDLGWRTVLPGIIDSHVHLTQTGLSLLGISLRGCTTVFDVLDLLVPAIRDWPHAWPIMAHHLTLSALDPPLLGADLDRVAPDTPLMVGDTGLHAMVVNRACLELLDLKDHPSGMLVGQTQARARRRLYEMIDDDTRRAAQQRAAAEAASFGLTTVHALEGGAWLPDRDVEVLLAQQADLPIRSVIYWQTTDAEAAARMGLPRLGGDVWVDGSYGQHTAALSEPYADDPSTRGTLYHSDAALDAIVWQAHRRGLQIALHAVGDRAIDQALGSIGRALARQPDPVHRHRIEHFSLPRPEHLQRAAKLGVALSMQPPFAGAFVRRGLARLVGPLRAEWRHPYRRIVDLGILVAGGSESDCASLNPWPAMAGLLAHPDDDRRLSAYELLQLYTVYGARIAFEENVVGTIQPGRRADLVVLEDDPTRLGAEDLADLKVTATLVGGRVVHGRLPVAAEPMGAHG